MCMLLYCYVLRDRVRLQLVYTKDYAPQTFDSIKYEIIQAWMEEDLVQRVTPGRD